MPHGVPHHIKPLTLIIYHQLGVVSDYVLSAANL